MRGKEGKEREEIYERLEKKGRSTNWEVTRLAIVGADTLVFAVVPLDGERTKWRAHSTNMDLELTLARSGGSPYPRDGQTVAYRGDVQWS